MILLNNGNLVTGGNEGSLVWWRNYKPLGPEIETMQGQLRSLVETKNGEVISGGQD